MAIAEEARLRRRVGDDPRGGVIIMLDIVSFT
jgi:hypothetical protein